MKSIRTLLTARIPRWVGNPPATKAEIAALQTALPIDLPTRYVDLLRAFNGGEGELALEPLWFQLFDTALAAETAGDDFYRREFKGLFFIGSNGGLESIAFDMRGQVPWPIVMVDCIAGIESAKEIAPNIDRFIEAIGVPPSPG